MKKTYTLILCLCLLSTSCVTHKYFREPVPLIQHDTERIVFKPYEENKGYQIDIPINYIGFYSSGAHSTSVYTFYYEPDYYDTVRYKWFSVIVPKDMLINIGNSNSDNWLNLVKSNSDKRYNTFINEAPFGTDTLIFSGKKHNRYWKQISILTKSPPIRGRGHIELEEISVGYINIPLEYKALFDSCLLTLRPLQDTTIKVDDFSRRSDSLMQIRNKDLE